MANVAKPTDINESALDSLSKEGAVSVSGNTSTHKPGATISPSSSVQTVDRSKPGSNQIIQEENTEPYDNFNPVTQQNITSSTDNPRQKSIANNQQVASNQGRVDLFKNDVVNTATEPISTESYKPSGIVRGAISSMVATPRKRKIGIVVILLLLLVAISGLIFFSYLDKKQEKATGVQGPVSPSDQSGIDFSEGYKLSVNVPLETNDSLIVRPTDQPESLVIGQIFLDQNNNQLFYYDGEELKNLGSSSRVVNNVIEGPTNINNSTVVNNIIQGSDSLSAGTGIGIANGVVSNTGVLSLQGQSGSLNLSAGNGISIAGLTVTNSGVRSVSGTANQVNVSGSTGNITFSLPQSIATSSSPTFAGINTDSIAARPASSLLTVGTVTKELALQGDTVTITANLGGFTSTLGFITPTANRAINLPDESGTICLQNSTNCGFALSSNLNLQGAYDSGNTIVTTDARDVSITLADTSTDADFVIDIASGSTGEFKVQNNGTDVLQIGSAGQLQLDVQGSSGGIVIGGDTNLYRVGADQLWTDDSFFAGLLVSAGELYAHNGTSNQVIIGQKDEGLSTAAAGIKFGGGSGDTNIYRGGANLLQTDDGFVVGILGSGGTVALCSNGGRVSTCTGAGANTLQGAYDGGNAIATTDARDIDITLANTATDANFILDIATGSTGEFQIQNNGTDVLQIGSAGQLQLDIQGSSGGILLGGDVSLYRSNANQLSLGQEDDLIVFNAAGDSLTFGADTDSAFIYGSNDAAGDWLLAGQVSGDANERVILRTDGTINWGSGSSAADTNLYRSGANILATDDIFEIGTLGSADTDTVLCHNSSDQIASCNSTFVTSTELTLQGAYDGGNTIATTDGRDIDITLANTATDSSFTIDIATGSTGKFAVQGAGADIFSVNSGGIDIESDTQLHFDGTVGSALVQYVTAGNALQIGNYVTSGHVQVQADSFEIQDTTGFNNNFSINNQGQALFQNRVNTTTAFQIQDAAGTTNVLTVDTSNNEVELDASGALLFGGDTALYRYGADTLGLDVDDSLRVENTQGDAITLQADSTGVFLNAFATISSDWVLASKISGDAGQRLVIRADGLFEWGDGTSLDTNLYRSAADVLETDDNFIVGSDLGLYNDANIQFQDNGGTFRTALTYSTANNLELTNRASTGSIQIENQNNAGNIQFRTGSGSDLIASLSATGQALFQNSSDSTSAFQIQNASGTSYLTVDTSNNEIELNSSGFLLFGADTNLYRGAADRLQTDDDLHVGDDLTIYDELYFGVGQDVALYRDSADTLGLDDDFVIYDGNVSLEGGDLYIESDTGSSITSVLQNAGDSLILSYVDGDGQPRFQINAEGYISWGDGSSATDTFLFRDSANVLQTGSDFVVGDDLIVTDELRLGTAGDTFLYRGGANTVQTDDEIFIDNNDLTVNEGGVAIQRADEASHDQGVYLQTNNGTDWYIYQDAGSSDLRFWNDNINSDAVVFDTSGKVTLNTTTDEALVVDSYDGDSYTYIQLQAQGAEYWEVAASGDTFSLYDDTDGTDRFILDGDSGAEIILGNSSSEGLEVSVDNGDQFLDIEKNTYGSEDTAELILGEGGTTFDASAVTFGNDGASQWVAGTNDTASGGTDGFYLYNIPNDTDVLWVNGPDGRVGISEGLDVEYGGIYAEHNGSTAATFNRNTNDGTIVSLQQNGTQEGTISVSGSNVSYNAFTGSHYARTTENIEKGMLVSLNGENNRLGDRKKSEVIYGVDKTTKANDPAVLGSYLSLLEPNQQNGSKNSESNINPSLINAVGNSEIWVVDNGQDLKPGDNLISSSVPGHAMKDLGTFETSHVIGKVGEVVNWDKVNKTIRGKKHKLVSVLFAPNDVKNIGEKDTSITTAGLTSTQNLVAVALLTAIAVQLMGRLIRVASNNKLALPKLRR